VPRCLAPLLFGLLALGASSVARAEVPVPPLTARVTDQTGTLTPGQRANLEETLRAFEKLKGAQLAVLIIPTTQPEDIAQYAIRVAEQWKLGRKGVDDGLLLLVAKDDRKLRIEVGRGLEGVVPDAVAKRVIAEIITPFFRQGDYYGGIEAGVNRLTRIIEGEPLPPPARRHKNNWSTIEDMLPFALFGALALGFLLRTWFGRMAGAGLTGGIMGVLMWIITGLALAALAVGALTFVGLLVIGTGRRGGGGGGGGWSSGGWSGGGGGWSGGDGGGFSGGGGDFGGGGASGGW
jgi:uncharacterized protein